MFKVQRYTTIRKGVRIIVVKMTLISASAGVHKQPADIRDAE